MFNIKRAVFCASLFSILISAQNLPDKIIVMIGDGMGPNVVASSLVKNPNSPFYYFENIGLSVTTSADKLITDSAAGATAIATGYLTNNGMLGISPNGDNLKSVFKEAQEKKYKTGLVVTSKITDATPAAFFANVWKRANEDSVALQFTNSNIDFTIGGGWEEFLPESHDGKRIDDRNLLLELETNGYKIFKTYNSLNVLGNERVVALLDRNGLPKAGERDYTLADLTNKALKNLSLNNDNFILMVEGSQIDWAGHINEQNYLLNEMDDFEKAVKVCLDFAKNDGKTLLIVTADHETGGMSITNGNRDGSEMELSFITKKHTASGINVFAYGPSSEMFRGVYPINQIGKKLFTLIK